MQKRSWQTLAIPNQQGLKLAALYYAAPDSPRPTLTICHGFTGSKEGGGRVLEMSEHLAAELDLDCLAFDFAGHGQSQGQFQDLSLSSQIQDLQSVVSWCTAHKGTPVLTMGRSFGACTAICQAAQDKRVRAVCSWAAPADPYKLLKGLILQDNESNGLVTLGSEHGQIRIKSSFFPDLAGYDVPGLAARISPRPLLVIHGEQDETVPVQDAELIYKTAGAPKRLHIIPGADHRFSQTYLEVWQRCANWLQEHGFGG